MNRKIEKSDISGARIAKIHETYEIEDGLDVIQVYFTTDKGLTFIIPIAGREWTSMEIPDTAKLMEDEFTTQHYAVRRSWLGIQKMILMPPVVDNAIKRIKQHLIVGIFCNPTDECYPDKCVIVLDDESQVAVVCVSPHGTGAAGLYYHKPQNPRIPKELLVDYFSIRLAD
jgi:hypothetical protein